jgi:hypothetical protein
LGTGLNSRTGGLVSAKGFHSDCAECNVVVATLAIKIMGCMRQLYLKSSIIFWFPIKTEINCKLSIDSVVDFDRWCS